VPEAGLVINSVYFANASRDNDRLLALTVTSHNHPGMYSVGPEKWTHFF
jgi:hypothetical protein